jgi:hypothetical protein
MTVWCAGLHLHTKRLSVQSDIYQMSYWYNWFFWWWAHGCPKHVENRNKHTWKRIVRQFVYLQGFMSSLNCQFVYLQGFMSSLNCQFVYIQGFMSSLNCQFVYLQGFMSSLNCQFSSCANRISLTLFQEKHSFPNSYIGRKMHSVLLVP